jgi:hypothetical protein
MTNNTNVATSPTEKEKSKARALLRFFATEVCDQRAVEGFSGAIRAGEEGIMDHICYVIDAVATLSEEFAAWNEGHTVHDPAKCKARRLLAMTSGLFNEPTPELANDEFNNMLDVYTYLYVNDNPDAQQQICCLVEAIYILRDDLIAYGRDDLNGWERAS